MNRTTKPKGIGIAATMLLATLLIAAVIVPAVGAQTTVQDARILGQDRKNLFLSIAILMISVRMLKLQKRSERR